MLQGGLKFDLRAGYDQILMDPVDIYKATFPTHEITMIFSNTFRLFNTPTTFQAIMNLIFNFREILSSTLLETFWFY